MVILFCKNKKFILYGQKTTVFFVNLENRMVYIYLVNVFCTYETENIFYVLKDISSTKIKNKKFRLRIANEFVCHSYYRNPSLYVRAHFLHNHRLSLFLTDRRHCQGSVLL